MHYVFLALTFLGTLIHQCARDIIFAHTQQLYIHSAGRPRVLLINCVCSVARDLRRKTLEPERVCCRRLFGITLYNQSTFSAVCYSVH